MNSIENVVCILYSARMQLFLVNDFPIFAQLGMPLSSKLIHRTIGRGQFSLGKHFKVFATVLSEIKIHKNGGPQSLSQMPICL